MLNIVKRIKCFIFGHFYSKCEVQPFEDSNGNKVIRYTCERCNKTYLSTKK